MDDSEAAAPAPPKAGIPWLPLVAGFVPFVLLGAAFAIARPGPPLSPATRQPIAFNHKKHVKELELACPTCHVTVETEAFSSLPAADVCSGCHAEAQGKSAEEARLVALLKKGEPLRWSPLFRQPAHLFYSHRRHVVAAKLACPTCHGSIAETTSPPGHVRKLRMNDCLACHREKKVSTDCTACHR